MNRRRPWASRLALSLALLSPAGALTEGAVKLLDCETTRVCDQAGNCSAEQAAFVFRMEPLELGAGGVGSYTLTLGESSFPMQALSDSGPFIWNPERERNLLVASSETDWLWHRLRLDPSPGSTIRFLRCSFQQ